MEDDKGTRQEASTQVADNELARAYELPAANVNRMIASNLQNGMRIAFGEGQAPSVEVVFRSAVLMSYDDAEALAALIQHQLSLLQKVAIKVGPDGKAAPLSE